MSVATALLKQPTDNFFVFALKLTPGLNMIPHGLRLWRADTALQESKSSPDAAFHDIQSAAVNQARKHVYIAGLGNLAGANVLGNLVSDALQNHHHPVAGFFAYAAGMVVASAAGAIPGDVIFEPMVKKAWDGVQARFSHQVNREASRSGVQTLNLGDSQTWERLP